LPQDVALDRLVLVLLVVDDLRLEHHAGEVARPDDDGFHDGGIGAGLCDLRLGHCRSSGRTTCPTPSSSPAENKGGDCRSESYFPLPSTGCTTAITRSATLRPVTATARRPSALPCDSHWLRHSNPSSVVSGSASNRRRITEAAGTRM